MPRAKTTKTTKTTTEPDTGAVIHDGEKPAIDEGAPDGAGVSLELNVAREQVENSFFVMLERDLETGKFTAAELWDPRKSVVIGAKTVAEILSSSGIDRGGENFLITFSPNTGEVIAAKIVTEALQPVPETVDTTQS